MIDSLVSFSERVWRKIVFSTSLFTIAFVSVFYAAGAADLLMKFTARALDMTTDEFLERVVD